MRPGYGGGTAPGGYSMRLSFGGSRVVPGAAYGIGDGSEATEGSSPGGGGTPRGEALAQALSSRATTAHAQTPEGPGRCALQWRSNL